MIDKPRVIGICGKKYNGKDTVAEYISNKYNYEILWFGKSLKDACMSLFGFTDEQLYSDKKDVIDKEWNKTPREIMQYLGTNLLRKQMGNLIEGLDNDIFIRRLDKEIKENPSKRYIIADVRFQNEIDMIKKYDGIIIKVFRDLKTNNDQHESENIDKLSNIDIILDNNGSKDELKNNIDKLF